MTRDAVIDVAATAAIAIVAIVATVGAIGATDVVANAVASVSTTVLPSVAIAAAAVTAAAAVAEDAAAAGVAAAADIAVGSRCEVARRPCPPRALSAPTSPPSPFVCWYRSLWANCRSAFHWPSNQVC